MRMGIVAILAGAAFSSPMISGPLAAATPSPPEVCYAAETGMRVRDMTACLAPGGIEYQQGAHQPTYDGANPLVPYGTSPHVPLGTNTNNAG
ncbi:Hypothetical protein ERS075534_04640 [Mycobacteroides abscessus]|uniref:hypothetical protein n=2 Tax=Mycobacteriaceae TaxID=1762 RepID=UPI0005E519F2|nr:hypothetical protein [Mycobacteroides abscessus]CPT79255.1 Hypothetical protein ERS075534_04640 [Mycobacteroides abscessus]CPU63272.1 Hypothetical protein ERS075561_04834 [Mycobacteroides abscessus]SKK67833.1 Uncharacterised protein [Mycobacteroides abscessus subsp. massiliense]SKQ42659.1 Uncharacterised protein [Mycobacteroides abscessus subsp. massiliense]SKX00424.1 Uncharacterised protein [Mycobacteroides abscessus subsp. massiliense]